MDENSTTSGDISQHQDAYVWIDNFLSVVQSLVVLDPNPKDQIEATAAIEVVRLITDILHALKHNHDPNMIGKTIGQRIKEDFSVISKDNFLISWFKRVLKVKK